MGTWPPWSQGSTRSGALKEKTPQIKLSRAGSYRQDVAPRT
jgi:hypothetical protein